MVPLALYLLPDAFFTWYLINAPKIRFLACHFLYQRLLMTPTAITTSQQIILYSSFSIFTLSHLNLLPFWEALKSPLHTSQNPAKVSTLFIFHIFLLCCLCLWYFFVYLFPNSEGSIPFYPSRSRLSFSCSRTLLIPITKSDPSLFWTPSVLMWSEQLIFTKHLLRAKQHARCFLCVIF